MKRWALAAGLMAALAAGIAGSAAATTFRWANDADSNSLDPYARQETFLLSFDSNIYEPLVRRDAHDLSLEPALAVSWTQLETNPLVWRFKLRPGVKFQDGTPFGADDVVFSHARVLDAGSNMKSVLATVKEVRKVDDLTVDFETTAPDPILPDEITNWDIMSKAWCEKNNAQHPADLTKNEESYATTHAMGTGPFMLKEREPDVRTVLVKNPTWWDQPKHNLDEVIFQRVANPATRVAALLSGELDMLYAVPSQDVDRIANTKGFKIVQAPELRTIYLGLDEFRPELLESNVKGKNPYKDKRVRQAMYQAIDEDAIVAKVMRGQAKATALMVGPGVKGFSDELNKRQPYDPAASKKLLAEAGYPNGFETGMDCPTDRYVNDEQICLAVVSMLAKVGIKVNLLAQTRAKFFAKVNTPSLQTSLYLIGWTPTTIDAHNALLNLLHTPDPNTHAGDFNLGGYSNPALDTLIDQIQVEIDQKKRLDELHEALKMARDDVATLPLHQQAVIWATKDNIDLVLPADDYFALRYVNVK
jgi:peptide/nickel transport system substrate-binding protein